ncbi:hypothetical protein [Hymenobacter properus]|uniref:Uncharacterized protein n=1 Tax=Hymenobacter properus TaxID=2791026 RepID=A0A931FGP2_9BACT|nr:hypothetical protein [Hymenobacter properus]MBF9140172.1 hypothetical protein [Hymenobacter properus]MBR7718979.1 hypothetical protein [Microvirga sp. SRT04]
MVSSASFSIHCKRQVKRISVWLVWATSVCCSQQKKDTALTNDPYSEAVALAPSDEFDVSLVKLIANPEKYDGKTIQVIGFLNLEFEGDAIYLHKEDFDQGLTRNGFWESFSEKMKKKSTSLISPRNMS